MRYAQLVMGPAGCGKSTFCSTLTKHAENTKRLINVVNLDPAAEYFDYTPYIDIRELIHLDDAMEDEEFKFGPNGGLVFCMEYLLQNIDWLHEELGDQDDDYVIFDCPGQIELYTHMTMMRQFVDALQSWNFRVCGVFLVDAHFMLDGAKFLSGSLAAMSVMINLEIPHINILSKVDLLSKGARREMERFLEPDPDDLLGDPGPSSQWSAKYRKLTQAIGHLLDDYSLVRFFPLNIRDEENVNDLLTQIDLTIQYGEETDVKTQDFEYPDKEDDESDNGLT